jgi:2,4-dienoyl-CoA reductase-like NADH-dependent reductase (Old Yellow Enzyme family)
MAGKLFEPISINSMQCRNRFLMSAAADNLSHEDGYPTDASIDRYRALAAGGVGVVVSGGIHVIESGKTAHDKPHLITDEMIPLWKPLVDAVHDEGGCVALQLTHGGLGSARYQNTVGRDGISAGQLPEDSLFFRMAMAPPGKFHAATEEELQEIIEAFGKAAARVSQTGADAVELHSAHDSFLCQCLSPITNTRQDAWGGPIENRIRIHREILKLIRTQAGADFPVGIKLGIQDGVEGGLTAEEGLKAAHLLAEEFDFIEISQALQDLSEEAFTHGWKGTPMRTGINRPEKEAFFRPWSHELKQKAHSCTVALTGGIRSYEVAEDIVESGDADLVGLCRPLIMEPNLVNDWAGGDHHRARCVSCNKCVLALALEGKPLQCYLKD